jgi:sec-independent protein translocase protein TatA
MNTILEPVLNLPLFLGMPGITELWPILAIVVFLFGAKKLPELSRSMGASITQFRKGLKDADTELNESTELDSDAKGEKPSKE